MEYGCTKTCKTHTCTYRTRCSSPAQKMDISLISRRRSSLLCLNLFRNCDISIRQNKASINAFYFIVKCCVGSEDIACTALWTHKDVSYHCGNTIPHPQYFTLQRYNNFCRCANIYSHSAPTNSKQHILISDKSPNIQHKVSLQI